jgi:diacylglycerol kinase (ATP)
MRVTLIHNPSAGDQEAAVEDLITSVRDCGHEVVYHSSKEVDLDEVLGRPGDLVVAAGGDGTVRKVAQRLLGRDVAMTVLPMGTANNIAKTLGLAGSSDRLIASWEHGRTRPFDVGIVAAPWGQALFLEGMGLGVFTHVMSAIEAEADAEMAPPQTAEDELRRDLRVLGRELPDYEGHPLQIRLDEEDLSGRFLLLEAMNIKSVGPRLSLAPAADPSDGCLDLVLLAEDERQDFSKYVAHRLAGNEYPSGLRVCSGEHLEISWAGSPVHIDDRIVPVEDVRGTNSGHVTIDVRVARHALRFLLPPTDQDRR